MPPSAYMHVPQIRATSCKSCWGTSSGWVKHGLDTKHRTHTLKSMDKVLGAIAIFVLHAA